MNVERSLTSNTPTVRQLLYTYQMDQIQIWMRAQLNDLNEYVGVKNKMETEQMRALANLLIVESDYLKATEILLFFHKLKAGDFGGFYGAVDPQKVGECLIAFKNWRSAELDKVYNKQAQERREQKRKEWQKTGITRKEYEELRMKNGQ